MKTNLRLLCSVLALVLAFAAAAFAQTTGTVEGAVTDPNGGVVKGATVTLTETATGRSVTTTTNDEGFFTFRSLVPGNYSVMVAQSGFSKATAERVVVQVGTVARADIQLKVGGANENVNVDIGDTEVQVDTTRQTVDGVVTAKQIVALPLNERNFLDLAVLQPGVTVVDGGVIDPTKTNTFRAVRVNGGSGTGTRVQIEGIDVTDETVGTTTANFSTDAVQEFNLARSSFDLATSLTTSGAVAIASRTGGNQFNGSAFWFLQRDTFDARPGFTTEKPDFKRDQYGYRFGGPIIKDKLFFFSNAEKLDQTDFTDFGSTNFPGFNDSSVLPIETFNSMQRIDWHINDNTRFFYLFNHSDDSSTGGSLWSPFQNIDWTNTHVFALNVTGKNLTHAFRFGIVNFNNRIASTEIPGFEFVTSSDGTPFQVNVGDLSWGPNSLAPQQTYQDNYQTRYDGSWVAGAHVIRFGGDWTRILLGGFANFAGPATLNGILTSSTSTNPMLYTLDTFLIGPQTGFFTARPAHNLPFGGKLDNRYSFYFGDQWKATRNLTINFGVRWNYDTNFFSSPDVPHLASLDIYGPGMGDGAKYPKDAFSPQFGFAWDPWGDGKTSIRGGAYLAYEANIFNNSLFDEFARIKSGIGPTQLSGDDIHDPNGNPIVVNGIPNCPVAQTNAGDYSCLSGRTLAAAMPYVAQVNAALQAAYANVFSNYDPNGTPSEFDVNDGVTFGGQFSGDYKIPYSLQFNIGFQREIARGHVLTVDYVRQKGVGLPLQLLDYEARRDSRFMNEAAIRASIGTTIGVAPAAVNPGTIQAYLNTHPGTTINTFALANDTNWPGFSSINTRARLLAGGFSLYQGLQVSLNGRFGDAFFERMKMGGHSLFRGMTYTLAYALSRNESTAGSVRPEFIANTQDNRHYNSAYGPNGLDRTHNLTISASLDLIGGFRLDQIYRLQTAPPVSLFLPQVGGANAIFRADVNGDGGVGSGAPRTDLLPGTNIGDFGRRITNLDALNQYIVRYNNDYAGRLTPHGQRLVTAGLFSEAQLIALGAVTPTIALVPLSNPNPFETRFNADMKLSRPIRFGSNERFEIEPSWSVFNVFNNNAYGTYGGLTGGFGSLNYDYSSTGDRADLAESRGLIFRRRQMQFGIRFTF
ncbi:MAG: hypothetical protein DMF62_15370 [Acidobacteria bacterium]|nr:MAG: hypothetical protein DMF62_15370 [Acidobacteriota bacterium]